MSDNKAAFSSSDYDANINNVLPYYSEFHNQITDVVMAMNLTDFNWLDLGCGTGTLVYKASRIFKNCKFTLCDISKKMLELAKDKLSNVNNIEYKVCSNDKIDFTERFDVVTAVQSNHYFSKEERKTATQNVYNALKDNGIYITFENIEPATDSITELYIKRWENYMKKMGRTQEQVKSHLARRGTEVFPITVEEHIKLLKECKFKAVDILWLSYMQAGFLAIK